MITKKLKKIFLAIPMETTAFTTTLLSLSAKMGL
jgi:hypothetical protein